MLAQQVDFPSSLGRIVSDAKIDNDGWAEGPERALLSALLFDGIQNYMNYAMAAGEAAKARYREAYNWVHDDDSEYVFSFLSVCDALGIEPEFIRLGLSNVVQTSIESWTKRRRTF
jgi:hypothetical protein